MHQCDIKNRMESNCKICNKSFDHQDTCPACSSDKVDRGKANATINRELAALKRMFNLGAQQSPPIVRQVPHVPMLQENNVREGFFTYEEYRSLLHHIPGHLKPVLMLGYKTGMRKEEILSLTWDQIDLKHNMLRLTDTKTNETRNIPISKNLGKYLSWYPERNKLHGIDTKWVFLNRDLTNRIGDFRKSWITACTKAGLGKRLFHGLRRTAVRNMIRAGVPEKIAMAISGHKTRSVFDRYNIVDEKDLTKAMMQTENYLKPKKKPPSKSTKKVVPMLKRKRI